MELGLATFADLSSGVALAAVAARTERIRLSSAVTVLSSDDPVRVFQQFSELDLISGGRAEIMAGRGSFTESCPLFGYDLEDYDDLYTEKLDLLLKLRSGEPVTWSGRLRASLHEAIVSPRPVQDPLPVWVAVGGSPQSVARAGALGLPVAINTHAFVGETSHDADTAFAAPYLAMMNRIGRERGWPPSGRREYESLRSPQGAVAAGDPEQVAEKILMEHELFRNTRYVGQMSVGAVAHADVLRSMELFGTRVAPIVRAELARRAAETAPVAG